MDHRPFPGHRWTFRMFAKIVVKGEGQHPLYQMLTRTMAESAGKEGNPLSKVR